MATVFDKILDTTTGPKSYDWYRKKVASKKTTALLFIFNATVITLCKKGNCF